MVSTIAITFDCPVHTDMKLADVSIPQAVGTIAI